MRDRFLALAASSICAAALAFSAHADVLRLAGPAFDLTIDTQAVRLAIDPHDPNAPEIPADASHGLSFLGSPAASAEVLETARDRLLLRVVNAQGEHALVDVRVAGPQVRLRITPERPGEATLRLGAMAPAYGAGDSGGQHGSTNLAGFSHPGMHNDGGRGKQRFISNFTVFPAHRFAMVLFEGSPTTLDVLNDGTRIGVVDAPSADVRLFVGPMPEVYAAYKAAREDAGFPGVAPKFRFFELGWESWDAMRWQTDQPNVIAYLQRFLDAGYPVRWAVTGSGFWEDGGTTTSFGLWNRAKYPDPAALRSWLRERDIAWLIGLRTNFAVADAPFTPELLDRGYELRDPGGAPVVVKSTAFPRFDCYMLDGRLPGAAEWYADLVERWGVDGFKEDTMMTLPRADVFNAPMRELAGRGSLVMARCAAFTSPGTLARMEDMYEIDTITTRVPVTFLQLAASAAPNVYVDTVGFGGMDENPLGALRHAWLSALTAGMAVGAGPWSWPADLEASLRESVRFHWELAPYLYSQAARSHLDGYPHTLTPLPIAFPDDPAVYDLASHSRKMYQWLVGPSLLAAPLLHEEYRTRDVRDVYLPAGRWTDYATGETFEGPTTLAAYPAPHDAPPCFVGGPGLLVRRAWPEGRLEGVAYPRAAPGELTVHHPEPATGEPAETSLIVRRAGDLSPESVRIADDLGRRVSFRVEDRTGAIVFPIEPARTYVIRADAPMPIGENP